MAAKDKLVIVESPTKAKTISKFLGNNYRVESSFGHVRDLPKSKIGVDVQNNFEPTYVDIPKAKKRVSELKKLSKKSSEVILATDEDREGESISWHLMTALELDPKKAKRIVFHEITKNAIEEALKNPRSIDENLVNAQQARRILDRLVGYELSPLLWKKIYRGLSAGRVQSVALRLIVERERERQAFKAQEYWTLEGLFNQSSSKKKEDEFKAFLLKVDGEAIPEPGIASKKDVDAIISDLEKGTFTISKIKKQETKRSPLPPFTTSSMVAEAASKLKFSAAQTMKLAQQLYEGIDLGTEGPEGLITYMRTDSLNLSREFLGSAEKFIKEEYGENYHTGQKVFKTSSKSAQEAHEAIRPTNVAHEPQKIKKFLDSRQYKLYDLIWRRATASQMKEANILQTSVDIEGMGAKRKYVFRANGSRITFDGFLKLYPQRLVGEIIPPLEENQKLNLIKLEPEQHFTQPPARYSEGTLVKMLEKLGIGRPSTYAPTISTIQYRGYVEKDQNKRLSPTDVGFLVTDLLTEHFPTIVDTNFTARMEDELDKIAQGQLQWTKPLQEFYPSFHEAIQTKESQISKRELITQASEEVCEKCGKPMVFKLGRFGKFLACSGYPECKNTKSLRKSLNIKCPKCSEGEVIERKTKRGKLFYGCSNYPKCDFATWQKPNGQKCPACNEAVVETPKGQVKCSKCSWVKEPEE
ncbi:type I DNA topoisomerase [Candidatus Parcubacteria bacterium]|nr:MAG: type I DNA topoisomerase [Candidatus Parcubacteria bacterium]